MRTGNNICDCPDPPGGIVICEPDQLAICRIKSGHLRSECKGPPQLLRPGLNRAVYFNWALAEITEEERRVHALIDDREWKILREGVYSDSRHNLFIVFRFPRVLTRIFPEMARWPSLGKDVSDRFRS